MDGLPTVEAKKRRNTGDTGNVLALMSTKTSAVTGRVDRAVEMPLPWKLLLLPGHPHPTLLLLLHQAPRQLLLLILPLHPTPRFEILANPANAASREVRTFVIPLI